jgi:hypothetical protein
MQKMSRVFSYNVREADFEGVTPEVAEASKNRKVNRRMSRTAGYGAGGAGGASGGFSDIQFATGRPRDPLFYWRQNNLPYDFSQNEELAKVRSFTRLLYQTDPIIGSCVDIFSRFPIIGHEITCKNDRLVDFYGELFFDEEHLDYEEFLEDIGREYYIAGEAWPFSTFNEDLGIWDDEELLNPDDIKVERSPFLKEPQYFIRLPWVIRQILQSREPAWQYNKLVREYPELTAYTSENAFMPVSNILLNQLKFKGDTFNVRGLPLLTRAMRSMLQQEMLNTAMDAIADRLYTPLILCKLGASASDLGTTQPWIPTEDDLENFELALDAALAGDFRALIYNFAVEMVPVLGREQMPDLTPDFERIEDRILQVFGLSKTFLTGASGGQTYAADALNRDLITQLLSKQQKKLRSHWRKRCRVVAEANSHFDYREHGGRKYVEMEEVLETDEETGEKRIVEQPRLLIPELKFQVLNLKDQETQRQFIEAVRASGVPISMKTRTRHLDLDLEEEEQISADEAVRQAVLEQETRRRTFIALREKGYPVPGDLMNDFAPRAQMAPMPPLAALEGAPPVPRIGAVPQPLPSLAPTPDDEAEQEQEEEAAAGEAPPEEEDPGPGEESARPPESDEQRQGMPSEAALFRRTAASRHYAAQRRGEEQPAAGPGVIPAPVIEKHGELVRVRNEEGQLVEQLREWVSYGAPPAYCDPWTTGYRRHAGLTGEDEIDPGDYGEARESA